MGFSLSTQGSWEKTVGSLNKMANLRVRNILEHYGQVGTDALARATPVRTALAASSWTYKVSQNGSGYTITWSNTNVENGFPVAIMLQYGHGTGTGGYVQGIDYINPALKPVFDKIIDDIWKAVQSS